MGEHREYVRIGVRLLAFIKVLTTGKVHRALTRDIGGGGLCIVMEGVLEPGTSIEVELKFPDCETPVTCTAEVVWSKVVEAPRKGDIHSTAQAGVKFVKIDPKDLKLVKQFAALNALPLEAF